MKGARAAISLPQLEPEPPAHDSLNLNPAIFRRRSKPVTIERFQLQAHDTKVGLSQTLAASLLRIYYSLDPPDQALVACGVAPVSDEVIDLTDRRSNENLRLLSFHGL